MPDPHTFTIVELPKPRLGAQEHAGWTALAKKFRELRLRSLQVAPEAFTSRYEAESRRGLGQTFDRLENPKARQFVAVEGSRQDGVAPNFDQELSALCERDWIGMIVLVGPVLGEVTAEADPMTAVEKDRAEPASGSALDDGNCEVRAVKYVLNGVFVEPSARGKGVGKALVVTALEAARCSNGTGASSTFVTVLVNAENAEARSLYEKTGFVVMDEEEYTQEPRALLGEERAAEKIALKMCFNLG